MRYNLNAHFIEEQRKGFAVHHTIDTKIETFVELQDRIDSFLSQYNPRYCYGLVLGISEEPSLIE